MCKLIILYSLASPLWQMWDVPHFLSNRKTTDCEMDQSNWSSDASRFVSGNYGTEGAEKDKIRSAYGEERYMMTQLDAKQSHI